MKYSHFRKLGICIVSQIYGRVETLCDFISQSLVRFLIDLRKNVKFERKRVHCLLIFFSKVIRHITHHHFWASECQI